MPTITGTSAGETLFGGAADEAISGLGGANQMILVGGQLSSLKDGWIFIG